MEDADVPALLGADLFVVLEWLLLHVDSNIEAVV